MNIYYSAIKLPVALWTACIYLYIVMSRKLYDKYIMNVSACLCNRVSDCDFPTRYYFHISFKVCKSKGIIWVGFSLFYRKPRGR